jgi:hypothetical protein
MAWRENTDRLLGHARDAFGEEVVFRPEGSDRQELRGIFRSAHVMVDRATGASVSSNQPTVDVRLSDITGAPPAQGDIFLIRGVRYVVADPPEADGEGAAKLFLKRAVR